MATETLVIPEENLSEVADVITVGLHYMEKFVSLDTKLHLERWCVEVREYLKGTA